MSKKWLYILVVAVMVIPLILAACAPTEAPAATEAPEPTAAPEEPEATAAPEEEPTAVPEEEPTAAPEEPEAMGGYEDVDPTGAEVLWWHQHGSPRQEGLNEMVEEFNNTNEWGIQVTAEFAGQYDEIYDKMIAAIAADDPTLMPNLTVGYANQVAKYQLSDALVDMDEFVDSEKWGLTDDEIADFPIGIFEADVSPLFGDGHFRMGFPPNRSMEMLYYNQDWLTELGYDGPPETWEEFREMACAATDPDAGTVGYEISTDASRFATMVFSRHGNYFAGDGSTFTFTNDTVVETMQFMKDLYDEGCATLIAESYGDQTDFGNYKTLFTIGSSSGLPYYDRAVKSGEQGEFLWSVAAPPYMDGGDEPVMNLYGASISVPKTTPEQELAAWLFVKWFTEPEQNARWAKISNYFPTRKSAADSMADYMAENPTYAAAFELLPYSTYEAQWCPCYEEVRRLMEDAYNVILDGADIDATLAQLEVDTNASLAENLPGVAAPEEAKRIYRIGVNAEYPPFENVDANGNLVGFDIDLMNAIADASGFIVQWTNTRWDGIFVALAAGEFDAVISAATITEERAETVDFSDPYFEAGQSITIRADTTDIAGPADLDGRPVGVQLGTTGDIWLTDETGAEVVRYDENTLAFQALANGDVDAAVADAPTAIEIVKANPEMGLTVLPDTYTEEVYGIAVNKDKPELLETINAGLAAVMDSGEYDEIYNEYFAVEEPEVTEPEPTGELFWTPDLRQAIAAAIDREEIVDRVFEGRNTPAYHMVPPGYPYATEPFLDRYGFRDLDMSIQLLTDAGYTEDAPFEFVLSFPPEHYGTTTADVMQVIKEQLEETGLMKVELQSQNWAEYVDSFVDGNLPFFILGWFPDFADPETWLSPFGSCIQSPDQGVNYCSDVMDPLLAQAAASSDPAEREALYQEIGDLWAEDIPTIPLFWEPEFVTVRDGVEGVDIGATFEFNYNILSFGDGANPASGSTDTIIIGTTDEVHSLDAQDAYAIHDWEILKNTGVSLMSYIPGTSEMIPGAAADFPVASNDGKTYTFTLREGITYADGTPVTAQDYVYAWDRLNAIDGDVSGLVQLYVESVEAPDDLTVVYNLNDAFGFFPALAATAPFIPSNPNQFPADTLVSFPEELDGIGAYRMASYTPGEQMVLEANPNYWGDDPAKIPTVIVRYFSDPTTMSNAVETGEIDVAWRILGAVEAVRLMDVEGLTVTKIDAPALRYLVFNHTYTQ